MANEDLPDSEHAIVVYDFEKDTGYVCRFETQRLYFVDDVRLL